MSEQTQPQFTRETVPHIKWNGVRVEFWPDGTTMIFGDPLLSVQLERQSPTQSGHLTTMIIFKQAHGLPSAGASHSRPTQIGLEKEVK